MNTFPNSHYIWMDDLVRPVSCQPRIYLHCNNCPFSPAHRYKFHHRPLMHPLPSLLGVVIFSNSFCISVRQSDFHIFIRWAPIRIRPQPLLPPLSSSRKACQREWWLPARSLKIGPVNSFNICSIAISSRILSCLITCAFKWLSSPIFFPPNDHTSRGRFSPCPFLVVGVLVLMIFYLPKI